MFVSSEPQASGSGPFPEFALNSNFTSLFYCCTRFASNSNLSARVELLYKPQNCSIYKKASSRPNAEKGLFILHLWKGCSLRVGPFVGFQVKLRGICISQTSKAQFETRTPSQLHSSSFLVRLSSSKQLRAISNTSQHSSELLSPLLSHPSSHMRGSLYCTMRSAILMMLPSGLASLSLPFPSQKP